MQKIKEYREKLGITQQELADKVGLSQETISQYEMGTRTPKISTAKKIADVLGGTVDAVFFGRNISK